jgi:hypothetical protein
MWLMARVIKSMGIKMVFLGRRMMSYLWLFVFSQSASNAEEFHEENVQIKQIAHV